MMAYIKLLDSHLQLYISFKLTAVDWIGHFKSIAEINKWDDAAKLLWLQVRLTGRAQNAFKQLSDEAREVYADCKKALWE